MSDRSKEHSRGRSKSRSKALQVETSFARWPLLAAAGIIIVAGLLAYHNSFSGPFIFDDANSIQDNPTIRRLWPIWNALSPPAEGQAVQRRPIVNLSLAINYRLGGLDVTGYHIFNLGVHILAALTLFAVVRRTLRLAVVSERLRGSSTALALAIALIWTVHPLLTDAVTYIIQRTELLAGLFYLLTLYCVIRGSSARSILWYVTAVITCTLGMGSKEPMVSAPLVILLYDRLFLCSSFKEVFRRRWFLYVALAATWGLVVALIPQGSEGAAVLGQGSASLDYASTQFETISNYLRLCFWPEPLILDYGIYKPTSFWEALPYAILVIVLLIGTVLSFRRRPWIGFLGVWFFAILAPSSSFVPVMAQSSAEKRMYLPLAAVITMVVLCGHAFGKRLLARMLDEGKGPAALGRAPGYVLSGVVVGLVVVGLGMLTVKRNNDYRSELSIWQDTTLKRPNNPRAYNQRGDAYRRTGDFEQAIRDFNEALKLDPSNSRTYNHRGVAYAAKGDYDRGIQDLNTSIELNPEVADPYNNRGNMYRLKGDYEQGIRDFDQAINLNPSHDLYYFNRGLAYRDKGNLGQAIGDFSTVIKLNPRFVHAYFNRGLAYQGKAELEKAIGDFSKAIELDSRFVQAYFNRGLVYQNKGDFEQAIGNFSKAIELNPRFVHACNNLGWILATHPEAQLRDGAEAVRLAERACALTGYKAPATLDTLAAAYAELGQFDKAVTTAEQAIQLARAAKSETLAKDIRSRLELYKAKRPHREQVGP